MTVHLRRAALIVALACAATAEARDLGRLFYTPEQRASLEKMRLAPPARQEEAKPEPPPAPGPVSLQGVVTRSSGRSTTWVNGVPRNDSLRPTNETVRVPIGDTKRSVPLKVGETYEAASGQRHDLLNGGSIRVKRAD